MTDEKPNDDELLNALGRHARERQTREALRPLSDDFESRMVEQIKRDVTTTPTTQAAAPRETTTRTTPWLAMAASLLAAIGLTFTFISRDPSLPLPGYALEFRGGAQVRSAGNASALQVGDQLVAVLRPDVTTDQPLTLTVYRQQEQSLTPIDVNVRWSDDGAARVTATVDPAAGIGPGTHHWLFVVAPDGEAPSQQTLLAAQEAARDPRWQALRIVFDVVP